MVHKGYHTGTVDLPLHYGKAPKWLFGRMVRLSREIIKIIVWECGPEEILKKVSDSVWFQAFGCVLGFDWHSSGLTTTVCGAMKESIKGLEKNLGVHIAGGKGRVSRKTPDEIKTITDNIGVDPNPLIYASRMTAKVDSSALQDGYQIYQHNFMFTKNRWAVVQQGMNENTRYARRYHWFSSHSEKTFRTGEGDFVDEPHAGICSARKESKILNLVAKESSDTREISTEIARDKPEKIIRELNRMHQLKLPRHHEVVIDDINPARLSKIFLKTYELQPTNFEQLLGIAGVGPKTVRALALVSELLYGRKPSFEDPVRFSFAHGGKDGHPYPVDRKTYENTINFLHRTLNSAKLGRADKLSALRRLNNL
jgi:hypothetical protein